MSKKKGRKRFDPTAESGYPSRKAFNRQVRQRAMGQIRPTLQDIAQRRREARGAHDTRVGELGGWYGADQTARQAAFDQTNTALNDILTRTDVMGDAGAGALDAALRRSNELASAEAANLGVSNPGVDPAYAQALGAYGQAGQMGLAGNVAGYIKGAGADLALSGQEQKEAGLREGRRFDSIVKGLSKERTDVRSRLPELIKAARSEMIAEQLGIKQQELAESQFGETKRSNKANENLAQQQQNLAEDQFGETQKQNKRQYRLNKQDVALRKQELNQAVKEAKGTDNEEKAKAAAERFDRGVEWVNGYLAPTDQDKGPGGKFRDDLYRANRSFEEAYTLLKRQFGMGELEALRVLMASPSSGWRGRAERTYHSVKDARRLRNYPR